MSGHSKWHSIKHKKGIADSARGKVFTKHAKLIEIASKKGGDPNFNPTLRLAIENAKKDNVPNANIERAVKKGTGELKEGNAIEEITYEAYGPSGIALLVHCLTDNKNRTIANLRPILSKHGGRFGENGSVAWMFHRKGVLNISTEQQNEENIELAAIDAGALDIQKIDQAIRIITSPSELLGIKEKLEKQGIQISSAAVEQIPENTVNIKDEAEAQKIIKLMELLEEDDDVDSVSANFDIDDTIL